MTSSNAPGPDERQDIMTRADCQWISNNNESFLLASIEKVELLRKTSASSIERRFQHRLLVGLNQFWVDRNGEHVKNEHNS